MNGANGTRTPPAAAGEGLPAIFSQCVARDDPVYAITTPFLRDGYYVATDHRILVRIPCRDGGLRLPPAPATGLLPPIDLLPLDRQRYQTTRTPFSVPPRTPGRVCRACRGTGRNDQQRTCPACAGAGATDPDDAGMEIASVSDPAGHGRGRPVVVKIRYLRILQAAGADLFLSSSPWPWRWPLWFEVPGTEITGIVAPMLAAQAELPAGKAREL